MVNVFIQIKGDKMGGRYEVESFPVHPVDGFIFANRIIKKTGEKKRVQIGMSEIARIEEAEQPGGRVYDANDMTPDGEDE